jgi:two-component system alkaline phosphatase synthesis response regulator PhoP
MPELRARVVIAEDDDNFAALLAGLLEEGGYEPVRFRDANRAFEWLKDHQAELIICDICMEGISGIQLCELLKASPGLCALPILVVSALEDEAHKVQALRAGADDYVVKPFAKKEFLARVEALLRRTYYNGNLGRTLVSGGLLVNLDAREATLRGERLDLLPKEYDLLVMFLARRGRGMSFCSIGEFVWGPDFIATRDTIKVHIHRLRSKLGQYGSCVEAMQGFGYKWRDPVETGCRRPVP